MSPLMRIIGTLIYKFFGAGLSFLIAILTARYLGTAGRGYLTVTISNFAYYSPVVGSFSEYIPYGINRKKHDPNAVFTTALWYAMVLSGALFLGAVVGTPWLLEGFGPLSAMDTRTLWVAGLVAPFAMFHVYVTRLVWGLNENEWLNRLNTVQPLVFIPLLGLVIWLTPRESELTAFAAMAGWAVSYMLAAGMSAYVTLKHCGVSLLPKRDRAISRETFRYGTQLMGARLLTITNMRIDVYLVFFVLGASDTGVYSIAVTIAEMLLLVSGSILQVVMTRLTALEQQDSSRLTASTFRHTAVVILFSLAVMYAVMPPVARLAFGAEFEGAIDVFYIMTPGLAMLGLSNVLTTFFTNQLGRPRVLMYLEAISIVVNVGVSLWLLPQIGQEGTAWAKTGAYGAMFLFSILYFGWATKYPVLKLFRLQPEEREQYAGFVRKVFGKFFKR